MRNCKRYTIVKLSILNFIKKYQIFDFFVIFSGRGIGGVLNFLFIVFTAKLLGSEKFGLFALSITVMQISLRFAGQGIDTVLVRFYILQVQEKTKKEAIVLKACLYLRILLTLATVGIGIVLSELYVYYSNRPDLRIPLLFGFIGCGFASFLYYFLAIIQAAEKYVHYSFLSSSVSILKVFFLFILFMLHQHSLFNILSLNVACFFLGMSITLFFVPRNALKGQGNVREAMGNVFGYGKWIVLSSLISILYNRVDVLILSSVRGIKEVGFYCAAFSFTQGLDLIIVALFTVFLPSASKIRNFADAVHYLKFSSTISVGVLSVLLIFYCFSDRLLLSILGAEYMSALRIFKIIFPGFLLYLFTFPWALVIYSYNKPHLLFMSDVAVFLFNFIGGLIFIPSYGMFGASWVNLFTRLFNSAIIIYLVTSESKKIKHKGELSKSPIAIK